MKSTSVCWVVVFVAGFFLFSPPPLYIGGIILAGLLLLFLMQDSEESREIWKWPAALFGVFALNAALFPEVRMIFGAIFVFASLSFFIRKVVGKSKEGIIV